MKWMVHGAAVAVLLSLSAAAGSAQEMESGTWTGTVVPPGGEGVPVTYRVGLVEGALTIVMNNDLLGDIPLHDARLDGAGLTFWWEPGTRVDCALQRQADRSFSGTCTAGNGEGAISMMPPEA